MDQQNVFCKNKRENNRSRFYKMAGFGSKPGDFLLKKIHNLAHSPFPTFFYTTVFMPDHINQSKANDC